MNKYDALEAQFEREKAKLKRQLIKAGRELLRQAYEQLEPDQQEKFKKIFPDKIASKNVKDAYFLCIRTILKNQYDAVVAQLNWDTKRPPSIKTVGGVDKLTALVKYGVSDAQWVKCKQYYDAYIELSQHEM